MPATVLAASPLGIPLAHAHPQVGTDPLCIERALVQVFTRTWNDGTLSEAPLAPL